MLNSATKKITFMKKLYLLSFLLSVMLMGSAFCTLAQVSLPLLNTPYTQPFDSLAASGTANDVSTLPHGWTFVETGTNANATYAAGTGSSNTGNTYSFGSDAGDRALGGVLSGSLVPTIGAGFINHTGGTITSLAIAYRGEQWRLGATGRTDRLDFQYSTDATSLSTGSWTDVNELDFNAPVSAGTVGALAGNDSLNRSQMAFTISGLNLEPGHTFYLRWQDFNASGADDGLAIDNFVLTPQGIPSNQPSIVLMPASLDFGDVNVNSADTLSYTVTGSNLTDSIRIAAYLPAFTLSTDGVAFNSFATLPDSGGLVYVRFAPTAAGAQVDSITHLSVSSPAFNVLFAQGNGFDQVAAIIPVAEARTKAAGQKVTVAGRVTVGFEHGNPAYVQDATGGIPVFDFALASSIAIGDSIIVTGPIGVFNDQKQISGAGIFYTLADSIKRIPQPRLISLADLAANEGLLVTVQNVSLVDPDFVFYPQSTERITANGAQGDLRIDGDTDIPGLTKPQGVVDITGVVGRFKTNAQLLPRFREDIPGATEPTLPSDTIPASATFDVVNWNLEFFGAKSEDYRNKEFGPADEALQLQNVKTALEALHADVIAVQEVSDDSLFAVLVSQLGRYAGTCSDRYSYSFQGPSDTFPPQKVCFIYDTTTVSLVGARALFEARYDSARLIDPSLLPGIPSGDASSFYSSGRLPYLLTVEATINGVKERISFIDIHAKSGDEAADHQRRQYDALVLKDSLDAQHAGEKFIILGDLNDDLDTSIVPGLASSYAGFVSDTARYAAVTKALSDAGARSTVSYDDVIDHQVISRALAPEYISGSARIVTPFLLIPNYASTTSDHLAVMTRYAFRGTEATFVQTGVTVVESSVTKTVTLTVDRAADEPRIVQLAVSGAAAYGSDFTTQPAVVNGVVDLRLPAQSTSVSFNISVLQDLADELDEAAVFTVIPSSGIVPGAQPDYTLTIQDNDVPVVAFAELLPTAKEGSGDYQVRLRLSVPPASDQQVTVYLYEGPGVSADDYVAVPAVQQNKIVLDIPAGSTQASFTITPKEDARREFPEILTFYLGSTTPGLKPGSPLVSLFTILDVSKRQPQFVVFPNPTTGPVRILAHDVAPNEVLQAELRNPDGGLLYSGSATPEQLNHVVSGKLQSGKRGIYTLKLNVDGEVFSLRILKL